jgi:alpha-tubulin suppressor-like RCC1 family protein
VDEKIVMIASGHSHNVILTQNGRLFSFGFGEFGTLGQGGSIFEEKPKFIKKLNNRVITSLACGLYHTLALSSIGDVYAWGRGFEGQLGIL